MPSQLVVDHLQLFSADMFNRMFPSISRIAVIGNGAVDEEDYPHIRDADMVVRFNNWNSRVGAADLNLRNSGTRCDVVFSHLDCQPVISNAFPLPKAIILAVPAPFQINRNAYYLEERYRQCTVAMVNPFINRLCCLALGYRSNGWKHPLPTVGGTFLYHFWRFNSLARIYVCGFDWHYIVSNDSFQGSPTHAPIPGHFNHVFIKEARWIQKELLHNPLYTWSNRALAALERLEKVASFPWEQPALAWPYIKDPDPESFL